MGWVHAIGDLFIWFLDCLQPSSHYIWEPYWKLFTVASQRLSRQYQLSETMELAWALKSRWYILFFLCVWLLLEAGSEFQSILSLLPCLREVFPFVQFRNQNQLMKSPEVEARSQQNPLHSPPNILSSWPIFMNIMMQGTTGAKTAIPSAEPCLTFSHTCIIRNTDRYVAGFLH